jgi:Tol biopolymer transport system component
MNENQNRRNDLILAIKEEQIVVAPESKVRIHIAIINQGPNEEYVDILVKGVPSDWTTIDRPVVHLGVGEAKQVILTVEPPPVPQSRVGQYPLDVHAVSQSDPTRKATASSSLTVAAYQSRGRIGVMLGSVHFSISPGSSINIPILLQNRGPEEDSFRLSVKGVPPNWVSTNSALTRLEPTSSKEINLTVRVPRSPEADAGRTPIRLQFSSQNHPDQQTEVECILTVSAYSKFSASLQPETLQAGQGGQLIINNEGNTVDTYSLSFASSGNNLIFEKGVPASQGVSQTSAQRVEIRYVEIPPREKFKVKPGERGLFGFRGRLRTRPIVGKEQAYPFSIQVLSSENKSIELPGEVNEKGLVPNWLISVGVIGILLLCIVILLPVFSLRNAARATQTAVFNQTQAVLSGQDDSDGDGLINNDEVTIGTDPFSPDSDADGLLDGDEVHTYQTNPLLPDSDEDGLLDGAEIQIHSTDPLNPDTDADGLTDGQEIDIKTVPIDPDTDRDGLNDGDEVALGTDPRQQDTDRDGLLDGQENQTCPLLLEPDSDNDGIIDGVDIDPCDPNNPSLTVTALASTPTVVTPGVTVVPTAIPSGTAVPTNPAVATPTLILPGIQGTVLFESNRDGNSEIYALELTNQSMLRVTNDPAVDTQPALAPDGTRVAYVSNQNGNNDIYITGLDLRTPVNITNNPADDQQPTWSPDGNWIAFTTNRDGNQAIYIMRSDGTELRSLTGNLDNNFSPTWFSVNRLLGTEEWIAFTSTRDGNQEIYKIRPDGTGLENLTQNSANDHSPAGAFDGLLLTFVSDRDGNQEIYTMTDSGGAPNNITNSFSQDLDPTLSPNGDWIAFTSNRDGNLEIYVIQSEGGNVYDLTRNPGQDRNPDW